MQSISPWLDNAMGKAMALQVWEIDLSTVDVSRRNKIYSEILATMASGYIG
jgi:hypothetical protein